MTCPDDHVPVPSAATQQACIDLGADVCAALAERTGRRWPEVLARQMRALLA